MAMRRKTKGRPFGFVKVGSKYALVFGSRKKPRLGKRRFKTRVALAKFVKRKYMKRR